MKTSSSGAGGTGPTDGPHMKRGDCMEQSILVLAMCVMLALLVIDRLTR